MEFCLSNGSKVCALRVHTDPLLHAPLFPKPNLGCREMLCLENQLLQYSLLDLTVSNVFQPLDSLHHPAQPEGLVSLECFFICFFCSLEICYSYDVTQNPAHVSAVGAESPTAHLSLGQGSANGCKSCFPSFSKTVPAPQCPWHPLPQHQGTGRLAICSTLLVNVVCFI